MKFVNVGVSVMIENDKGQLLMGRRSKEHSHGIHTWCTPGGHIKFNEKLEDACRREVFEEVGIRIKNIKFMGITNDMFKKEKMHYVTIFFNAQYKSGKIKSTPELEMVDWYDMKHLPTPLFLCMRNFIKKLITISFRQPTICVYGCGKFKNLMKHYKEVHPNENK